MSHNLGLSGKINMHGQSLSFAIQLLIFFNWKDGKSFGFFKHGSTLLLFLLLGLGSPRYFQYLFWNQCHKQNHYKFDKMTIYKYVFIIISTQFVKALIPPRKIVKMVLYWLAHGLLLEMMSALYGVGQFTIKKYTYIMCGVLFNVDKFFFNLCSYS
jgi:hypothetical protein